MSGLTAIIAFICISAIWGKHPVSWLFTSLFPHSMEGVVHVVDGCGLCFLHPLKAHQCFLWGVANGCLRAGIWGWNPWRLWHPYLFIWQEILHFTVANKESKFSCSKILKFLKSFSKAFLKARQGKGIPGYMISRSTILWWVDGEVREWCHRGYHYQSLGTSRYVLMVIKSSSIWWWF